MLTSKDDAEALVVYHDIDIENTAEVLIKAYSVNSMCSKKELVHNISEYIGLTSEQKKALIACVLDKLKCSRREYLSQWYTEHKELIKTRKHVNYLKRKLKKLQAGVDNGKNEV